MSATLARGAIWHTALDNPAIKSFKGQHTAKIKVYLQSIKEIIRDAQ